MSILNVPEISTSDLRSAAWHADGAIRVRLAGSAESAAKPQLDSLLARVHSEAQRLDLREVVVDMRELEFMNSSCFKAFVSWAGMAEQLEQAIQYKIRIVSDETKLWQRRSLAALACFAAEIIRIETKTKTETETS
jgi:hypothetical protein